MQFFASIAEFLECLVSEELYSFCMFTLRLELYISLNMLTLMKTLTLKMVSPDTSEVKSIRRSFNLLNK